tara:strand:- start:1861 stop:2346 length:486 start_codon:yes stop_codon:yes gene_type:complete
MSTRGVRAFYDLTTKIKDTLLADENVNSVTLGDITDIDLNKQTIFPLSHIIVNNATYATNIWTMNLSLFCMDLVDTQKKEENKTKEDYFTGNNNEQDVLNTQLAVVNLLLSQLSRGTIFSDNYQLVGNPSCEPFTDRFENLLAGWVCTFDVQIKNDINICS